MTVLERLLQSRRLQGRTTAVEVDKQLAIENAVDGRQHSVKFTLISNTDIRMFEFDEFHEARAQAGTGQITKDQVRPCLASTVIGMMPHFS